MTTFLVVCGQQFEIGRRVVTFLEQGAPNFYAEVAAGGPKTYGQRPGVPETADISVLKEKVWMLCIHHDATWDSLSCFSVLKNRGLSSHIFIDGDGTIFQPIDIRENTWHAGEVNNYSVGLDMNNVASPEILTGTDRGREYAAARGGLFTSKINGANITSCGYTEEQYLSLVAVIVGLSKALPKLKLFPPLDQAGEVIDRKILNYESFHGFLGHWHVSASKWDPGPGFDWKRVMVGIHGERNTLPVALPEVKDLGEVFSSAEVSEVANAYYLNNETGWSGYYPISLSQSWRSGIHLNVSPGQPVVAMSRGTIVAVRNAPNFELGSANFVLVKHTIRSKPIEDADKKNDDPKAKPEDSFVDRAWFSLYMHTQYVDEETPLDKRPAWHRYLGQDEVAGQEFTDTDLEEDAGDRVPKVGKSFRDLRARRIVLLEYPVKAGEVIGYVGQFGTSEEVQRDLVHVETFSCEDEPLFEPSEFPEAWKAIEADNDNNSLADVDQVWRPIFASTSFLRSDDVAYKRGERVLKGSEVQEFFQGTSQEKDIMRGYVCRHVSEWSDTVDWQKTAALAVGWQWETQEAYESFKRLWAPFQWMTAEVVEHAGLDENRMVWTYHPVTLIAWFHTNYGRQLSPDEYQQGFSNAALVDERSKEAAALERGEGKEGWHGDGDTDMAAISAVELTELELDDEPWKSYEQGEWPIDDI